MGTSSGRSPIEIPRISRLYRALIIFVKHGPLALLDISNSINKNDSLNGGIDRVDQRKIINCRAEQLDMVFELFAARHASLKYPERPIY